MPSFASRGRGRGALVSAIAVIASSLVVSLSTAPAAAATDRTYPPSTVAKSAIVIEQTSGQVLYSKNPDESLPPASITKVMTMLLTMEELDRGKVKLTDKVRASTLAYEMGGSQVYLKENEELSLEDMLKSIAIVSANDACVAVAEFIAGTEADFVDRMNQRAKELGMKHTTFVNTNGLPAKGHVSSARDIAIMSRALINHPAILKYTGTWMDSLRGGKFQLRNTNELIKQYPGADGLKTGWTDDAGFCLSGTAERNGMRLIAVVMKTPTNSARFQEVGKLLDYGFRNFERRQLAPKGAQKAIVKVAKGKQEKLAVVTASAFHVVVPKGNDVKVRLVPRLDDTIEAPVRAGQVLGHLDAMNGDKQLATVALVAKAADAKARGLTLFFRAIRDFFGSLFSFGRH